MRISDQRGFALFGLLLVAALIATLASTWGLEAHQQVRRDREQMLLDTGRELRQAIASYQKRNVPFSYHAYPEKIEDLLEDKRGSFVARHLRAIPIDPITQKREWATIKISGRIVCLHSSSTQRALHLRSDTNFSNTNSYDRWIFCGPDLKANEISSQANNLF